MWKRKLALGLAFGLLITLAIPTNAMAYNEQNPKLEYIRISSELITKVNSFDGEVVKENQILIQVEVPSFIGLTPSNNENMYDQNNFSIQSHNGKLLEVMQSGTNIKTDGLNSRVITNKKNGKDHIVKYIHSSNIVFTQEQKEARKKARLIASGIRAKTFSKKEMVKLANQYLVENSFYPEDINGESELLWTAYGPLVNGKAVCQGYADAFNMIMKELDIPVINITGDVEDSEQAQNNTTIDERHMWNMVKIDGEWLYVDVTFNDPIGFNRNYETYKDVYTKHLLLNEKDFYRTENYSSDGICNMVTADVVYRNDMDYEADILKSKGLFSGDDSGYRLEEGLTRAEMAAMLTRIVGGTAEVESDREGFASQCTFSDVPNWAKPYVGYCVEKKLLNGIGNGLYGAEKKANKLDYCSVVLRATGINTGYTYSTADVKAVELGYLSLGRSALADLTRGDVVAITYNIMEKGLI